MTARTRRAALATAGRVAGATAGALALPAGMAVAAMPGGDETHPLLVLWREHAALGRLIDEDETESRNFFRAAGIRAQDRMDQIEREIEAARPDDLIGLAVQAAYAAYWSRIGTFPDEVSEMAKSASLGLARHAGVALPEWRV